MTRHAASFAQALVAVAAMAWFTWALLPVLGLASAALLFLLPVLLAAVRGGLGPALLAALGGAAAYNFFLLEPRFTFRIHQFENLVSVFVFVAVAVVTSRLATRLLAREAEANERARASAEAAALSSLLAAQPPEAALAQGLAYVSRLHGEMRLVDEAATEADPGAFSSMDRAAAAWAIHNGDRTGHGTPAMAAAEWTFLPLAPRAAAASHVAALTRPADDRLRSPAELDEIGQLCQLLGQCRDRASLAAERRERELVEASDRLRRTLLASLAHDFRTPLTIVTGRLELMARQDPAAGDALAAARRLDRMMGNLLGAARIESGALAPAGESLDLVDVVSAACDDLVVPPGIRLHRDIATDLPFVRADPVMFHHVLANILDNALRHARTQVAISASARDGRVSLTIEDDGTGIAEADRDRIFERFHRLESSDRGRHSGLGLAIVKAFADAMNMPVCVSEGAAGGARFTLSLPAEGASASERAPAA